MDDCVLIFAVSGDHFSNKHLESFFIEVVLLVSEATWCFCSTVFVLPGSVELLV